MADCLRAYVEKEGSVRDEVVVVRDLRDAGHGVQPVALQVGLYLIVTSQYSSITLYQVSYNIQ
jgi:hypothetical protein